MIIIIGIMLLFGITICICLGGADTGKPIEIGKFIEKRGLEDDKSKSN